MGDVYRRYFRVMGPATWDRRVASLLKRRWLHIQEIIAQLKPKLANWTTLSKVSIKYVQIVRVSHPSRGRYSTKSKNVGVIMITFPVLLEMTKIPRLLMCEISIKFERVRK